MRKLILIIPFLLSVAIPRAQSTVKDSLLRLLPKAKEDTNKVFLYINIGNAIEYQSPSEAGNYYQLAGELSKKLNFKKGLIKYIVNYTEVLNAQGLYDSALVLNTLAVKIAQELNDKITLAKCYANLGNSYHYLNNYEQANSQYLSAMRIFEEVKEDYFVARMQDLLQVMYWNLEQYEKGIEYGNAAVTYFRRKDKKIELGQALLNLANNYTSNKNEETALKDYREALQISREIPFLKMEEACLLGIGTIYYDRSDAESMKPNFEKALQISKELEDREGEVISNRGMAMYFLLSGDFFKAKSSIDISIRLATEYNFQKELNKSYKTKSSILMALHEIEGGLKYLDSADIIANKLNSNTTKDKILNLDKKYQTEKKEIQIKLQQSQLKQKSILIYVLMIAALVMLLLFFLGYRNYKSRQKLQQAKIAELETEKKLTATEAVLKGEEQERTRLAKDLHDGLGGMLSGIKYSLSNMKVNLIMTPENAQAFERSLDMLDSSIKEMRRVAHNMMPEMLVKYDLNTALREFCAEIDRSAVLQVSYQSIGMDKVQLDRTMAVAIYRIVQELINNTIKHAAAKSLLVQLHASELDKLLTLTVEDDGRGFDPSVLDQAQGIGWINIKNRVKFLKGKIDINSAAGKGTSVLIELNIT